MNRTIRTVFSAVLLLLPGAAWGQTPRESSLYPCIPTFDDHLGRPAGAPFTGKWIETGMRSDGSPQNYAAEFTVARDSQGRTYVRADFTNTHFKANSFEIVDPVQRIGFQWPMPVANGRKVLQRLKLPVLPKPGTPEYSEMIAKAPWRQDYWAVPFCVDFDPEFHDASGYKAGAYKEERLGTKLIQGVSAEGILASRTYSAGYKGSDRPVTVTHELWYSDNLQLTLSETITDSRAGTRVRQVTSLELTEPPSSTFHPPALYPIIDLDMTADTKAQGTR